MDVVTLGEALVVFSPEIAGPLRFVNNFSKSIGGAEANVAIALSRLGLKTGWISKLGNDEFGRYIAFSLQGEGIDISQVTYSQDYPTGILFKEQYHNPNPNVYYYRKNSAFTQLSRSDINKNYIKEAKILHITGISPALSESCRDAVFEAIKIAKDAGLTISFDPNLRLKLWDKATAKETLLQIAKEADIIFPGIDEAEFLLGTSDIETIFTKFHGFGAKIVALKLGAKGCEISHQITDKTKNISHEKLFVAGYPVSRLIDTVGAGDGFAAGFLAGVLLNKSIKECAEFANGVGAMATLVRGDSEGYPVMSQLLEFIGKNQAIER